VSDEARRQIERLGTTATPTDVAHLLIERRRRGELSDASLRLAALIGHAGARAVLDGELERRTPAERVRTLGAVLEKWGIDGLLRAALALARARVIADWTPLETGDTRPEHALDALDAWLAHQALPRETLTAAARGATEAILTAQALAPTPEEMEESAGPSTRNTNSTLTRSHRRPRSRPSDLQKRRVNR